MEIYIVTEVHEDRWHHSTVFSNSDDAIRRVQFLLKGYDSYEYCASWFWKAYYKIETALRTTVKTDYITIDHFTYLSGHDEWVFNR